MKELGWETGQDDEELFEFAMHDRQYRDYRSGVAKQRFETDLQKAKDAVLGGTGVTPEQLQALKHLFS